MSARRQINNYDDKQGLVHLPGIEQHDSETLCGHCITSARYEDCDDPITCRQCLITAKEIAEVLRDAVKSGALQGKEYRVATRQRQRRKRG